MLVAFSPGYARKVETLGGRTCGAICARIFAFFFCFFCDLFRLFWIFSCFFAPFSRDFLRLAAVFAFAARAARKIRAVSFNQFCPARWMCPVGPGARCKERVVFGVGVTSGEERRIHEEDGDFGWSALFERCRRDGMVQDVADALLNIGRLLGEDLGIFFDADHFAHIQQAVVNDLSIDSGVGIERRELSGEGEDPRECRFIASERQIQVLDQVAIPGLGKFRESVNVLVRDFSKRHSMQSLLRRCGEGAAQSKREEDAEK